MDEQQHRPAAEQLLEIQIHQDPDGVVIVRLIGEIDMLSAPLLRETVSVHLTPHEQIVLDMGGVQYIGSHGLQVLLDLAEQASSQAIGFYLTSVLPSAARVFTVTGLNDTFVIADSTDELTAELRARRQRELG